MRRATSRTSASVTVPRSSTAPLEGNIAPLATATASYTSPWNAVTAVNDGSTTGASWGTWPQVGEQWVQLEWDRIVTVDRAGVQFFRDAPDESGVGMIPPSSWVLQYVDLATGEWRDVDTADAYGRSSDALNEVAFAPVTTTKLRAVMQAWGAAEAGGSSGILEFEAWAAEAEAPDVTAPTVTLQAENEPGASGWYTEPVQMVAAATDDRDPAPRIELRVDGGDWVAYAEPVVVSADGSHAVEARATDAAGNVSEPVAVEVAVDRTAPEVTASLDARKRVVLAATDELSGVARIEYSTRKNKQPAPGWTLYTGPIEVDGKTLVFVRVIDAAGNVSEVQEVTRKQLG